MSHNIMLFKNDQTNTENKQKGGGTSTTSHHWIKWEKNKPVGKHYSEHVMLDSYTCPYMIHVKIFSTITTHCL